LELPYNKLLVSFGQNAAVRRVVILDLDWLYETDRDENFRFGLGNLSTQMYVRSNLGNYRGFSGHCAYNRTSGAFLLPDPDGNFEEVLRIARIEDENLVYKKQGAVWNFPATREGRVTVRLMRLGAGVRISLTDRWINPADESVTSSAFFYLDTDTLSRGEWHEVELSYDTVKRLVGVRIDGTVAGEYSALCESENGLSYLHLQTLATSQDTEGTLIKRLEKRA
jgi:hypothetical protein